jgi:hypothetical protein
VETVAAAVCLTPYATRYALTVLWREGKLLSKTENGRRLFCSATPAQASKAQDASNKRAVAKRLLAKVFDRYKMPYNLIKPSSPAGQTTLTFDSSDLLELLIRLEHRLEQLEQTQQQGDKQL